MRNEALMRTDERLCNSIENKYGLQSPPRFKPLQHKTSCSQPYINCIILAEGFMFNREVNFFHCYIFKVAHEDVKVRLCALKRYHVQSFRLLYTHSVKASRDHLSRRCIIYCHLRVESWLSRDNLYINT